MDTVDVLRALAILLVTLNHTSPWSLNGGMTALMFLSGVSFARFAMTKGTGASVQAGALRMAGQLFWPSLAWVLFYFAVRRKFDWMELFFFRNQFTNERIAPFPVWYVQVMLQLLLPLAMVFGAPGIARRFFARPLFASWLVVALGLGFIAIVGPTPFPFERRGHAFLWNFALGWVAWFGMTSARPALQGALFTAVVPVAAVWAWGAERPDGYVLGVVAPLAWWLPKVSLPRLVAAVLELVGQATFTIFLLHKTLMLIPPAMLGSVGEAWPVKFGFAAGGSLGIWVVVESFRRAIRASPRDALPAALRVLR